MSKNTILKSIADAARRLLPAAPETEADLRAVAAEAALATYELERLEAEREIAVAQVKETFGGRVTLAKKRVEALVDRLKAWALGNRAAFGKKRTVHIDGHALCFRDTPGALVCAGDEGELLEAILLGEDEGLKLLAVTVKPALDKVAIKAAIDGDTEQGRVLVAMGFSVARRENFDFKPAHVREDGTVLPAASGHGQGQAPGQASSTAA